MPRNDYDEDEDQDSDMLGDSGADTEATVVCPYCHQSVEITLDPGSGDAQEYVEDCEVCCQPWRVSVHYETDGSAEVTAEAMDD
jgi:hypothetical protein